MGIINLCDFWHKSTLTKILKRFIVIPAMIENDYRTPGQLIDDLLSSKGWTHQVLATVLDIDRSVLSKIIKGTRSVEAKLAMALSEVFEIKAERFLELQMTFDLAQARVVERPNPTRAIRAHLFSSLPILEMMKRGWMAKVDLKEAKKVEESIANFFETKSILEIDMLPHAAKKTNASQAVSPMQLAWLYRVKRLAREMLVPAYSEKKLKVAISKLKPLRNAVEETRQVPKILMDAGIRFLIVESLKGAKIDGVCFWLADNSPVVALSMRFDRVDHFWFVLRHELEHVLKGDGKECVIIDAELEGENGGVSDDLSEIEKVANMAAADFCVSQAMMDKFIRHKEPLFTERDVRGFSRMQGVHPGLIVGQLQRRTRRYELFRKFLTPVREHVSPGAIVDGWGDIPPTS